MAVNNNLYPPIVETYMPAFLINSGDIVKDTCRVYFSISAYNSLADIANAQVTVSDQNTNVSVLNEEKYPCDIMLVPIMEDRTKTTDDRYYVDIKKTDLIGDNFEINTYYKVQIRFTSVNAESVSMTTPQAIDSWLAANLSMFSEWSTVCLVRGISVPTLSFRGIDNTAGYTVWASGNVDLVGRLTFADSADTERLRSYKIRLLKGEEVISDTGEIYASIYNDINEINYTFKYLFEDGGDYIIEVTYTTNDLYQETISYNIIVIEGGSAPIDAKIFADTDEENGRILIYIKGNTADEFTGNIMIRRASSETNFTVWEDIHLIKVEQQILDLVWYDTTVKSGVWYRYCAQEINGIGQRSVIIQIKEPIMMVLDHMYLVGQNGKQLKIKFNPQVSSYQRTIPEAKVDTIGSKFPFIKRNGDTNYRQYSISGLISHFMDQDGLLIDRDNMYESDEILSLYDEYNDENRITPFNDYTYERDFREKVEEFLYSNDVKLFRSPTEGNALVKLMNIAFTPNQTLGRMLYSFTCTAYEIAEDTIDNYNYYGIQTLDEYLNQFFAYTEQKYGQLENVTVPANIDVLDIIAEEAQKTTPEGLIAKTESLNFIRIEMTDKPYLIRETADGPVKVENVSTLSSRAISANDTYTGYIVYINDNPIVIPPEGIYELKGSNVNVYSMKFPVDTVISMGYNATINQTEDLTTAHTAENFYTRMGQCWGTFKYEDSLYKFLWNKYYQKYSTFSQSLVSINSLNVEAEPGTIVYIRENTEDGFDRHVIGDTARLDLGDKEIDIRGFYFAGRHLIEASEDEAAREVCPEDRFIETGITVATADEIETPIQNAVYTITTPPINAETIEDNNDEYNNSIYAFTDKEFNDFIASLIDNSNRYIWYDGNWYVITNDNDVICPVTALVDYCFDIMKGLYA